MATQAFPLVAVLLLASIFCLGNCFKVEIDVSEPKDPVSSCISKCNEDPVAKKEECQCNNPLIAIRCPDHFKTMTRTVYVDRVGRMYRSGDTNAYNAFDVCNLNYPPPKVLYALKVCGNAIVGAYYGPVYHRAQIEDPILTLAIYDCIVERSLDMTSMERKQLRAYEATSSSLPGMARGMVRYKTLWFIAVVRFPECFQTIHPVCRG